MKIKFIQLFIVVLCLYSTIAGAVPWDKPTDVEVAVLPPYCLAKFRGVAVKQWEDALGSIYMHVHHYCGALVYVNRYYKSSNIQDRRFYLQEVISNLGYMVTHAEQSSALMPEIYLQRGITYSLLKKPSEALADLQKAIDLNPKLMRAYLVLADLYEELKLRDKALATVTEGLRHAPLSKPLQRRYGELGGKQPFPEPYSAPETKPEAAEVPVAKPSDEALSPKAIRAKREGDAQDSGISSGASAATTPAATPEPTVNVEPPKIGSPTNPYCRFCTD